MNRTYFWIVIMATIIPRALAVIIILLVLIFAAPAHDHWLNSTRSKNGAWCCGQENCVELGTSKMPVVVVRDGYWVRMWNVPEKRWYVDEVVPFAEALPSQDGKYYRCHDAQFKRICFFSPPPS